MMVPCCCLISSDKTEASMPGTGIKEPIRKTINAPKTNNNLDLSSPVPFCVLPWYPGCFAIYYSSIEPPAASIAALAPLVTPKP